MSTVGEVVDRVMRDYLYKPDEQPSQMPISGSLNDTATLLTYASGYLDPEEEGRLAPGTTVEINQEMMRVVSTDIDNQQLTVTRAVLGTSAASHADEDLIRIAPKFARRSVFDAVTEAVVALHPPLYAIKSERVISQTGFVEVDERAKGVLVFRPVDGSLYNGVVEILTNFEDSSTGAAAFFHGAVGIEGYLTYQMKFKQPTTETAELTGSSYGLRADWERIVVVGAVLSIVGSEDIDPLTQEFITESLALDRLPARTAGQIRDSMIRYYEYLIERARAQLRRDFPAPVRTRRVAYWE